MPREMPVAVEEDSHPEPSEKGKLDYIPPAWPEPPDSKSMLLRLGLGTFVVLGLCVGTFGPASTGCAWRLPRPMLLGDYGLSTPWR